MTRAERIEAALATLAEEAERVFLAVEDEGFPKGWKLPHLRNATAKARAALAPESGGPPITFDASEVEEVRALTGEWNNDLRRRVCEVVWRAMVQPPSSPSSAQGGVLLPCVKCGVSIHDHTVDERLEPICPSSEQPDPKVLEITERDRWAWRLGWSAAMSIRLDRPVNPSDAPEPPATAPRPGEG